MTVGKYTYDTNNLIITWEGNGPGFANLTIGSFCSISAGTRFYLGGNHKGGWLSTYPFGSIHENTFNKVKVPTATSNGDIIVGNDVWIGHGVTIMSGVTIGDGAIIAANTHVVQNVKPYSVVGGNPGKFYYFRFNEDVIEKLLKLKWWDMEDHIINEISPLLCSSDYQKLFDHFKI